MKLEALAETVMVLAPDGGSRRYQNDVYLEAPAGCRPIKVNAALLVTSVTPVIRSPPQQVFPDTPTKRIRLAPDPTVYEVVREVPVVVPRSNLLLRAICANEGKHNRPRSKRSFFMYEILFLE